MTRGIEDPTRVTRALQLAKEAKEQDHDVNVFLTDDAVVLAKPGMENQIKAPKGDKVFLVRQTEGRVLNPPQSKSSTSLFTSTFFQNVLRTS